MKRLAIVNFFDSAGKGICTDLATGKTYFIHYSAIESEDTFKRINKNEIIEVTLYRNLYMTQVDKCKVLEPDFDYEKYNIALEMAFRRGIDILSI